MKAFLVSDDLPWGSVGMLSEVFQRSALGIGLVEVRNEDGC